MSSFPTRTEDGLTLADLEQIKEFETYINGLPEPVKPLAAIFVLVSNPELYMRWITEIAQVTDSIIRQATGESA